MKKELIEKIKELDDPYKIGYTHALLDVVVVLENRCDGEGHIKNMFDRVFIGTSIYKNGVSVYNKIIVLMKKYAKKYHKKKLKKNKK